MCCTSVLESMLKHRLASYQVDQVEFLALVHMYIARTVLIGRWPPRNNYIIKGIILLLEWKNIFRSGHWRGHRLRFVGQVSPFTSVANWLHLGTIVAVIVDMLMWQFQIETEYQSPIACTFCHIWRVLYCQAYVKSGASTHLVNVWLYILHQQS